VPLARQRFDLGDDVLAAEHDVGLFAFVTLRQEIIDLCSITRAEDSFDELMLIDGREIY
jgi:hypothetical protein